MLVHHDPRGRVSLPVSLPHPQEAGTVPFLAGLPEEGRARPLPVLRRTSPSSRVAAAAMGEFAFVSVSRSLSLVELNGGAFRLQFLLLLIAQ